MAVTGKNKVLRKFDQLIARLTLDRKPKGVIDEDAKQILEVRRLIEKLGNMYEKAAFRAAESILINNIEEAKEQLKEIQETLGDDAYGGEETDGKVD